MIWSKPAADYIWHALDWLKRHGMTWRWPWRLYWFIKLTRVGYCQRCGCWSGQQQHAIAYSTASAWLCEPCGEAEDIECAYAWREYYSGLL